jgi:glucose-6-phosphate isomerase
VKEQQDRVEAFTEGVRRKQIVGYTGRPIRNIVSVGIGGSYLGPEFISEVLATDELGIFTSQGITLRFLSNVDPVAVERTVSELDAEETLVVR